MVGNANNPIVTTVAPTMPVLAASNMPTIITAMPNPPLMPRMTSSMVCSRFSAILDFSSITPIKINSGTAINISLLIMPKIRLGMLCKKAMSNAPKALAMRANNRDVPARVSATGKPINKAIKITANKTKANHSIRACPQGDHSLRVGYFR